MKKILFFVIILILFTNIQTVFSAKKKVAKKGSNDISVSAKPNKYKTTVIANFGNLQNAKSLTFTLIYSTNGQEEGAGGSITPKKGVNFVARTLLLGTCSKNVCRYHKNVRNIRLEVFGTLKSGKQFTKTIKVK